MTTTTNTNTADSNSAIDYILPWITVSDGRGNYLHYIDIKFYYTGNTISKIDYSLIYQDSSEYTVYDASSNSIHYIYIRSEWKLLENIQFNSAINTLILIMGLVLILAIIAIIADSNRKYLPFNWIDSTPTPINNNNNSSSNINSNRNLNRLKGI